MSDHIRLAHWMRRRFLCSTAAALDVMLPPRVALVGETSRRVVRLVDPDATLRALEMDEFVRYDHVRCVSVLLDAGELSVAELKQAAGVSDTVVRTLVKRGVLYVERRTVRREPPTSDPVDPDEAPPLRSAQTEAVAQILEAWATAKPETTVQECLLYGVTGSGKTEVYMRAASSVLAAGKTVMMLVPEIALTPQLTRRIERRFGVNAAIVHSRLTLTERYATWRRMVEGEASIVVGARSAVFAPLHNLGLIVVDEAHDPSYRSHLAPRYDAVEVARMRAYMSGACLVLGSATPTVEAFERTRRGQARLLILPERIGRAGRPQVTLVDMKGVSRHHVRSVLSAPLETAMHEALSHDEQVMILINRRGDGRRFVCTSCGHVLTCQACDVALVAHNNPWRDDRTQRLFCHHCDAIYPFPERCPVCQSATLIPLGFGSQHVETLVRARFPDVPLWRMDQDTTHGRHGHQAILDAFASAPRGILIGTQMIAKGHDWPRTTVVGVLAADALIHGDDFRTAERGYALLVQAAGRAGRADRPGHVFIQAYDVDNPVLKAVARDDAASFYKAEMAYRKRLGYPPFGHIASVIVSSPDRALAETEAKRFRHRLLRRHEDDPTFHVFDVAPAPLSRLNRRYRLRLVAKASDGAVLAHALGRAYDDQEPPPGVRVTVELDPISML